MYGKISNLCVVKCVEKVPPLHWLLVFFIISVTQAYLLILNAGNKINKRL